MNIIDLSRKVSEQSPVYPGDPEVQLKIVSHLSTHGYHDYKVSLGTHADTHIDGPLHMLAEGKLISEYPVDLFINRGIAVDVTKSGYDDVDIDSILRMSPQAVIFHTNMEYAYGTEAYYADYPEMPVDLATQLALAGIRLFGFNACSPDFAPFKTHKAILERGAYIVENLCNTKRLLGKEFTLHTVPLKIATESAPVRAYAKIEK